MANSVQSRPSVIKLLGGNEVTKRIALTTPRGKKAHCGSVEEMAVMCLCDCSHLGNRQGVGIHSGLLGGQLIDTVESL